MNGCSLCDTYLTCWAYVEVQESGQVRRQFNRCQGIPDYVDRMLDKADHLDKNDRRGKKGRNWASTHRFFVEEWNKRYERFKASLDRATVSVDIPMSPGYMAWYNRITVTYLTQPRVQSTAGMNESASSLRLLVSLLYQPIYFHVL